jgi:RNA polymerase sigma-70 factor (ECF subfamily)
MVNVARNIAIDKTRSKEFRNSTKTEDIENNVLIVDKQIKTEINPEIIGLKDLIEKLKPEHKIILDLVYFEGFTHVEVAEKLDIPLGTVKTRLRNAIITLRKVFN